MKTTHRWRRGCKRAKAFSTWNPKGKVPRFREKAKESFTKRENGEEIGHGEGNGGRGAATPPACDTEQASDWKKWAEPMKEGATG